MKISLIAVGLILAIMCILSWAVSAKKITTTVSQKESPPRQSLTRALVVPHHNLLLDQFPSYYATFSPYDRQTIKHIVLLSPNHFEPETTAIKIRSSGFSLTNTRVIPINSNLLAAMSQINGVVQDDVVFKKEHGVFLHMPLIAEYFPQADILPLLLTRNISPSVLDQVISLLQPTLSQGDTLLLVSTDFSHYLSYNQAEKRDAETLALIQAQKSAELLQLNDDYSDCPGCLYILLKTLAVNGKTSSPQVIFHGNSAQFMRVSPSEPTTSYFVLKW